MKRRTGMALLCGLAAVWLMGCNKPCATTSDCNGGDVCSAAICRAVTCEETIFARDPKTGACTALSGCFLTADQRTWQTCQDDPCAGLPESSCVADSRCQPTYVAPDVENNMMSMGGVNGGGLVEPAFACGGGVALPPTPGPNGMAVAPGVNTGDQPKHGDWNTGCLPGNSRAYAGCRAVAQITPQPACTSLTTAQCQARPDCSTSMPQGSPVPLPPGGAIDNVGVATTTATQPTTGQCFDLHPRMAGCDSVDAMSCLTNPACQPIGTKCYCAPGAQCDCNNGAFLGCQANDHLRRCSSDAECGAGERCDNDEDCIMPRTFASMPSKPSIGSGSCLGACVPTGCAGMGEKQCNSNPSCNSGTYGTVCHPQPYCASGPGPDDLATSGGDGTGNTCGCGNEFMGCGDQAPIMNIRPERSLLVRDPEIVDDPAFNLLAVLTQLAPAGQVDAFADSLLSQVGAGKQVASGAATKPRQGFAQLYQQTLGGGTAQIAQRFANLMVTTALVNRLDLATVKDCGEARITFAMTSAYTNGDQRMTMIVELKVPDDGQSCKTVAQRWSELSGIDDVAQRRSKLIALYTDLLKPQNLGQIRTNEFVNRTGVEPWELREFHIRPADGLLDLAPVAQTVDPTQLSNPALLSWMQTNAAAIQAGTAIVPAQFLAGSSTENGGRLSLAPVTSDASILALEKPVNQLACAGCHLTETKSPFVHIGERLASGSNGSFLPTGRAVIDDFLQKELPKRAAVMTNALLGIRALAARDWRPVVQTRVH
jgi:hypothetical protein